MSNTVRGLNSDLGLKSIHKIIILIIFFVLGSKRTVPLLSIIFFVLGSKRTVPLLSEGRSLCFPGY